MGGHVRKNNGERAQPLIYLPIADHVKELFYEPRKTRTPIPTLFPFRLWVRPVPRGTVLVGCLPTPCTSGSLFKVYVRTRDKKSSFQLVVDLFSLHPQAWTFWASDPWCILRLWPVSNRLSLSLSVGC